MTEPYLIPQDKLPEKYISIHTSDRNSYRRCRRQWNWTSALREHITPKSLNPKFFVGSAFHWALQDYHGYNYFGHPYVAFKAYYDAYLEYAYKNETENNPVVTYEEDIEFVQGMFDHYVSGWLPRWNQWQTLWIDEKPMVEVEFSIYIPELSDYMKMPVIYQGKVDGVETDEIGRIWIVEDKTASAFEVDKLQTDPQCSSYSWASSYFLPKPAEGILFKQFKKDCPEPPKILKNGTISTSKSQKTTAKMLQTAVNKAYGCVPEKYNEAVKSLMEKESDNGDAFIRYDYVRRNQYHRANEYPKILAESYEMLSKHLIMYPSPNAECSWQCDFRQVCLAMDGGSDWKFMLKENYEPKKEGEYPWVKMIKYPKKV